MERTRTFVAALQRFAPLEEVGRLREQTSALSEQLASARASLWKVKEREMQISQILGLMAMAIPSMVCLSYYKMLSLFS